MGEREIIYLSLHCHHQNDFCIKMGSDESHFNVSLSVRDKVTNTVSINLSFEEKGKTKRNRTDALLLASLTLTARPNRLTNMTKQRLPYTQTMKKMRQLACLSCLRLKERTLLVSDQQKIDQMPGLFFF